MTILRVPVWDYFDRCALVAPVVEPSQPGVVDVADSGVFQPAPNYVVDCRFRPLRHSGVHFQSGLGDDDYLKDHWLHAMMHRFVVVNAPGVYLSSTPTTCEKKTVKCLLGQMMAQGPPDGTQ